MKKRRILPIISLLLVAILAAAIWQRNNISALYHYLFSSADEIESRISSSKDSLRAEIEQYTSKFGRDFTLEEEEKIRNGELTPEEAFEMISDPADSDMNAESTVPAGTDEQPGTADPADKPSASPDHPSATKKPSESSPVSSPSPAGDSRETDVIISKYVAKLYLYKAQYIAELGQLEKSAKDAYLALPEEKRTSAQKQKILLSKLSEAANLEKICDTQVNTLLKELKRDLSEVGGDLAILDVIKKAYTEEKSLKKAYYLGMLS